MTLPLDLDRYRSWLYVLARIEIDSQWQGKFDASDVVQQTLLEAHRDRGQFRGHTPAEYAGWLRAILAHVLAHRIRQFGGTQQRDINREHSLNQAVGQRLDGSSARLETLLAAGDASPSQQAAAQEQSLILAEVLATLPADYREVLLMRNLEQLPFEQIATKLQRSPGATRMLWVRALALLKSELESRGVS